MRFYIFTAVNKKIRIFCSIFTCCLKIIICETTQHDIPEVHNLQTVTFCFCNMLKDFSHPFLVLHLIWHGSLEGTELHLHIHSMPTRHDTYTTVLYLTVTHAHRNTQQSDIYTLTVFYSVPTCTPSWYCCLFYLVLAHHQRSCTHNALSFSCC